MALSLSNLVRKKSDKPARILVYGPGGVGKTTLASEFPDAIFIQTEDGAGNLEVTSFSEKPLTKFREVEEAIELLYGEEHQFKTLVVDSLTRLEPMIWAATCEQHKWASIEEPGYGKGYVEAEGLWQRFLRGLDALRENRGMTIVMIAHEGIQGFQDPERESYDRYVPRLHKRAEALVRESSDVVGFLNQVVQINKESKAFGGKNDYVAKASGSGQSALHLQPRPAYAAKNRFDMPERILINRGNGFNALAPYLPGHRDSDGAADAA